jgi:hypothetical protein
LSRSDRISKLRRLVDVICWLIGIGDGNGNGLGCERVEENR